jgi:cadmium resistance transport/sequestration family protein
MIVLTVLFLSARATGRPRIWQIWAGQYAGIAATVVISLVAALGLTIVPDRWVGLLGLVPLGLGVYGLIRAAGGGPSDDQPPTVASSWLAVAGVTLANGADNISLYTPVFRTISTAAILVTVAVFAVGVAVWCLAGSWLGSQKKIVGIVERYDRWLVPAVFIIIGALIIAESGVAPRLSELA